MRLPLTTLEVFNAIARHGSLREAADVLGIKPSTVSHQLKMLEGQLGTALFIRTTRSISLTEAGRALLRGAGPAFEQLADAVESARTTGHAARGTLRLALPEFVHHLFLGDALETFCEQYPEIEIELVLTDALSDILGEELHAGFRLGDRISDNMIAVRITSPMPTVVAAGPQYLERNGVPETPRDLLGHKCIRYRFQSSGRIAPWDFTDSDGDYSVDVSGTLIANALPVTVDLAKRGMGFVYTFRDYCARDLEDGSLVPVLDKFLPETPGIFIYFPREYRTMMPLRLLIDHLKQSLTNI